MARAAAFFVTPNVGEDLAFSRAKWWISVRSPCQWLDSTGSGDFRSLLLLRLGRACLSLDFVSNAELNPRNFVDMAVDQLDVLVLNAGITPWIPLMEWEASTFDNLFNTNVRGPWFTIKTLCDRLAVGGSVIVIGSIAACHSRAVTAAYGGAKAALTRMMQGLVTTLAERSVRINVVHPGPVETRAWKKIGMPAAETASVMEGIRQANPLKRFAAPDELAEVVAFLASPAASYLNGAEIIVDGGMMASL